MFKILRDLNIGMRLLPKVKDFNYLNKQIACKMDGFHEHLERFDFLYFVWAYEKVLGFTYFHEEYFTIQKLLTQPKKPFSSRFKLSINELNAKDTSVYLETCRRFCD